MSRHASYSAAGELPSVLRVPQGQGRDFVVGDIHGTFTLLAEALTRINFNPRVDRLFLCGDLVDRGEQSHAAVSLLQEPWAFSVRGNHEQMLLDAYEGEGRADAAALSQNNGGKWFLGLAPDEKAAHLHVYRALPLAIEIPTPGGLVAVMHAEVPIGMNWDDFTAGVRRHDNAICESALWGRSRVKHTYEGGVPGITRIFCGHTLRPTKPQWLGNVCFLDTGACWAWADGAQAGYALSLVNVEASVRSTMSPERYPMLSLCPG